MQLTKYNQAHIKGQRDIQRAITKRNEVEFCKLMAVLYGNNKS
jgi:hypothetical protein